MIMGEDAVALQQQQGDELSLNLDVDEEEREEEEGEEGEEGEESVTTLQDVDDLEL